MLLKYRLEMDVIVDHDSDTGVIELARQHYQREGGVTTPDPHGKQRRVPAKKFIEGIDEALLELLEHHPLPGLQSQLSSDKTLGDHQDSWASSEHL
jgi:hypothetical protein